MHVKCTILIFSWTSSAFAFNELFYYIFTPFVSLTTLLAWKYATYKMNEKLLMLCATKSKELFDENCKERQKSESGDRD